MKQKEDIIVLLNMGGPNNLNEVDVFLKNMFNDKYILSIPQPIRSLVGFMIRKSRLKEATQNYKEIGGVSPIVGNTKRLIRRLQLQTGVDCTYIMRYTPPFSTDQAKKLSEYKNIYLIPLYPHYSQTTTKSSLEDIEEKLEKMGILNRVKKITEFYNNSLLNQVVIERIKEQIPNNNPQDYTLIFSAHGLPKKIIDNGDLYKSHIEKNVQILKQMLKEQNLNFKSVELAYQSRLGPMEWIRPYLEDKLEEVVKSNKKVIIYPIAFLIDNSETIGELGIEYKEVAQELGFEEYKLCSCPNYHPLFLDFLEQTYLELKNQG